LDKPIVSADFFGIQKIYRIKTRRLPGESDRELVGVEQRDRLDPTPGFFERLFDFPARNSNRRNRPDSGDHDTLSLQIHYDWFLSTNG
jgi:hypothetical protein